MKITEYVTNIKKEIDDSSINKQRKRHLEDELILLNSYQENHPEIENLPSALELFCDMNPNALECRRYEV